MVAMSAISISATVLVLLVFGIFKDYLEKPYHRIVFFIALCEFISAISTSLGTQYDAHSIECYAQYGLSRYFILASILWCDIIMIKCWILVTKGTKVYASLQKKYEVYVHIFCWGSPLLCLTLPFIDTDLYLSPTGNWCYTFIEDIRGLIWMILSFYMWVFLSVFFMLTCTLLLWWHIKQLPEGCCFLSICLSFFLRT